MFVKAYAISQFGCKPAWEEKLIKVERNLALQIDRRGKKAVQWISIRSNNKPCIFEVICPKTHVHEDNFHASNGWLHCFLKCKEIKKPDYSGENASANVDAMNESPSILKEMIDDGNFHLDCI